MRPILFVVPGWEIPIHSYGVMILIACFGALAIGVWRAKLERIEANVVYELASWLFLGGVVGARGMYVLAHLDSIHNLGDVLQSWKGGNVFYGCILGGLCGSIIYWFRRPFPFWTMTDVAAPSVAIGIAIGRIGCFLNGCCYGAVCDRPWAVCFPAESHAWTRQVDAGLISPLAMTSLPVHPTQIYASIAGFVLLGLLLEQFRRRRHAGDVMAILMIVYPMTRWPLEALRGDEPLILAGMTLGQNISIAVFACGVALLLNSRGRPLVTAVRPRPWQPARLPVRFHLAGRRWAWHWHPDEPEVKANTGKTVFDRKDSSGASRSRST